MKQVLIKDAAKGEYIKRKADANTVYVKGDYDRSTKSFECHAFDDVCKFIYIKANKEIFVGFDY
jgi:hypothetical protein